MKIAVVDDIHRDRLCLTNYLESYFHNKNINFEILPYNNGEDFLNDFEAGKFQLVFLDIFMDGINGMDVARNIYQKDRDVSIIFQSNSEEYGAASYSVHALYYLVKPYTEENFRCAMELFDRRLPADEPVLSFSSDACRCRSPMTTSVMWTPQHEKLSYIPKTRHSAVPQLFSP